MSRASGDARAKTAGARCVRSGTWASVRACERVGGRRGGRGVECARGGAGRERRGGRARSDEPAFVSFPGYCRRGLGYGNARTVVSGFATRPPRPGSREIPPRAIGFSPSVPTRRAPDSAILPKASEAAHASPDLRGAGGQTRGRGRARWHSRGSSPLGRARDVVRDVLRGDEREGGAPRGRGARRARRAPRRSSPRHVVVVGRSVARRRGTRRAPRRRPASRARRGARPRRRPRLASRVAARRRARGDDRGVGRRAQGAIDDASSEDGRR